MRHLLFESSNYRLYVEDSHLFVTDCFGVVINEGYTLLLPKLKRAFDRIPRKKEAFHPIDLSIFTSVHTDDFCEQLRIGCQYFDYEDATLLYWILDFYLG